MYYLYKKSKSVLLPEFKYIFNKFEDFYSIADLLEVPLVGNYYINIKSDSYKDIINFLNVSESYETLIIYIEVSSSLLDYICLQRPNVCLIESKTNYEIFKELVSKYNVLFKQYAMRTMYFAIEHDYASMDEALQLLVHTFPDVREIGENEISQLFVIDKLVFPRNVLIADVRMMPGRKTQREKCINHFGNDMVMWSMRKAIRSLLDDKIKYLKTGQGSGLMKYLPMDNLIRMANVLDYNRCNFMDIRTLLRLYEEGETINDYLQKRTVSLTDEEYYALR